MDNYKRNTTICVSEFERNKINDAAMDMFGTDDVPYATTVMFLIDAATDVDTEMEAN